MTKEEKVKVERGRAAIFGDGVQGLRHWKRGPLGGWLLIVAALAITLIIVPKGGLIPAYLTPGEIAARDVKAPRELLVEDRALTQAKKLEAADAVPLAYEFDRRYGIEASARIARGLKILLEYRSDPALTTEEDLFQQLQAAFGVPLKGEDFPALLRLPLTLEGALASVDTLKPILSLPIVANMVALQADRNRGLRLYDSEEGFTLNEALLERTIDLSEALERAEEDLTRVDSLTKQQRQTLLSVVQQQLRPTLVFNAEETEQQRLDAADQVAPVLFQVKKGEMVVREGERITADQVLKLRAIRESGRDNRSLQTAAGLVVCILLLLYSSFFFARRNISKFGPDGRDLLFLCSVFIVLFVLVKVSILICAGMGNILAFVDSSVFYYAIPFAVGAMLVRIVLNSETALLFALCFALLIGVLFASNLLMVLYVLIGSLVGAHGVRQCQTRTTLYRAGLWVGLVNMASICGLHLISGQAFELSLVWKLGSAFAGGLASAIVVNGTVPLIESLFKYTTDIKLLELANMNAPILRQLMYEAPGSYHHSILVANLAESAAEAINANPLLVRVAAYYHDIGKIKKPLYFIENSGGQRNRHDKLAPSMSALILTSHVKDGVELAREHKLGTELIDIIRQHHGTALIKFFYDRAKSQADPGVQQVDERDYRYHGPKPQTREAALIMLADSIEAASRTLTDPTPARIKGMVQKLINNIFIDGQLDECDLTLKDLNLIAKSFNHVLSGSFHHRVDYPEPVHVVREKAEADNKPANGEKGKAKSANTDRKSAEGKTGIEASAAQSGTEDLGRLGSS